MLRNIRGGTVLGGSRPQLPEFLLLALQFPASLLELPGLFGSREPGWRRCFRGARHARLQVQERPHAPDHDHRSLLEQRHLTSLLNSITAFADLPWYYRGPWRASRDPVLGLHVQLVLHRVLPPRRGFQRRVELLPRGLRPEQIRPQVEVPVTPREVGVVVGVPVHHLAPALSHVQVLRAGAAEVSPRHGLVVEKLGVWRIDNVVAPLAYPQAEVHVVELDGKVLFLEAPYLVEDRLAEQHTGRRHRAVVCGGHEGAGVAWGLRRVEVVGVHRDPRLPRAPHPYYYPRVLDPAVRIQQPRPHGPYLRPLGVLEHSFEPAARAHLRVVVEEEHVLSCGVGDGEVVDPRVVERLPERDDPVG